VECSGCIEGSAVPHSVVGLGIDSVPRPGRTRAELYDLVALLARHNATATFFVRHDALTTPLVQELVSLVKENGHEVGIHCEVGGIAEMRQRACESVHLLSRKHGLQVRYARVPGARAEHINELEFLGLTVVCGRSRHCVPLASGEICMLRDDTFLEETLGLLDYTLTHTTVHALLDTIWQ